MVLPLGPIAVWALSQVARKRPQLRVMPANPDWTTYFTDPRNAVFLVLIGALVIGGGIKVLQAIKARGAVDRLREDEPPLEAIAEAAEHGRAGVVDLFRLLGTGKTVAIREAAGYALSVLWKADQLVNEEEMAILTRGFVVKWIARRRYPRAIKEPLPIGVECGIPFLREEGSGLWAKELAWSFRIMGSDRASLETFSAWQPGSIRASFLVDPRDFPTNGPHRLVLNARAQLVRAAAPWQVDLPQVPFLFEFDPNLAPEALFALQDEARATEFQRRVTLTCDPEESGPRFLPIGNELSLRNPPELTIQRPLPCDLAHHVSIEFEGVAERVSAGSVVTRGEIEEAGQSMRAFPLVPTSMMPSGVLSPGERKLRLVLTPCADLGWAVPEIRSIWPGTIETEWHAVRVVRS